MLWPRKQPMMLWPSRCQYACQPYDAVAKDPVCLPAGWLMESGHVIKIIEWGLEARAYLKSMRINDHMEQLLLISSSKMCAKQ
eukprot:scaffold257855_cov18-Tisochrysis_lutea.AAC.2